MYEEFRILQSAIRSSGVVVLTLVAACAGTQQRRTEVTPAELPTLEIAHQRQGAPLPLLPESARGAQPVRVSYRVCTGGEAGRAADVQAVLGSPDADAVLLPALRSASWQVPGAQEPVCFLENLESQADGTWRNAQQAYLTTTAERLEKPSDAVPQIPEALQVQLVGKSVVGLYRMCLGPGSGAVDSVTPVVGIPGADTTIATALRSWQYKPAPAGCWVEPLLFTFNAAPGQTAPRDDNEQLSKRPRDANSGLGSNIAR